MLRPRVAVSVIGQVPTTVDNCSSNDVTSMLSGGNVDIVHPMGSVALNITGNVTSLDANTEYVVWVRDLTGYTGSSLYSAPGSGYYALTTFTTNGQGSGSFHISISKAGLPDGTYDIQVALNPIEKANSWTAVATAAPGVTITVNAH